MNKWLKIIRIPLLLLLLLPFLPMKVQAADPLSVTIHFEVKAEPGTVHIEADPKKNTNVPLPISPNTDVYYNVTSGDFTMEYKEAGDYYYIIYQEEGPKKDRIEYDTVIREVLVNVIYGENGELVCNLGINEEGSYFKMDEVVFVNRPLHAYLDIQKVAKRGGEEIEDVVSWDEFLYEITVVNYGKANAKDVVIIDTLPVEEPLLEVIAKTISDGGKLSEDQKTITWTIDRIPAGGEVTLSFSVRVPQVDKETSWRNVVQAIYCGGLNYFESGDPDATDTTEEAEAIVTAPAPALVIEKEQAVVWGELKPTKDRIDVHPGNYIMYYITVTNVRDVTLRDVVLTDLMPRIPKLRLWEIYDEEGKAINNKDAVEWNLGDFAPHETRPFRFMVFVPPTDYSRVWVNQATAVYLDENDEKVRANSNFVEAVYKKVPDSYGGDDPNLTGVNGAKTADRNHPGIWLILLAGGVAGVLVLLLTKKKRKDFI